MFSRPERICTHFSMLQVFHSSQNTSIGRYLVDILITHRVPNYLNQLLRHEGAVVLSLGSFSPSEFCTHTCISKAKLLQFIEEEKKNHWKKLLLLLRYDCYLLCNPLTCHSGSDAFCGVFFVHLNTNSIKEFFQQTCRATRVGQALVFLLQRISKRTTIEAVTTKGISRMWFGIFCFMGPPFPPPPAPLSGSGTEDLGLSFCMASAETPSR